jgi:ubiquinol-cytochrome c reductase cytochrome b subunit
MLGLVMAAAGTGYSLPWDARAFFSTRVAEGLMNGLPVIGRNARFWVLGGNEISTITLSRFFAVHVLIVPFAILGMIAWRFRHHACWTNVGRNAIAGGVVFLALAIWCAKFPAPLGPPVETMTAEYLPRPGAQFLWLYQLLKYVPGGLGSIVGVVLPGIGLAILLLLPRLKAQRLLGSTVLGVLTASIVTMTIVAYVSDRRDSHTREQLAKQASQESTWRSEPFVPQMLQQRESQTTSSTSGAPVMYMKFCVNCHGPHGEGAQQGTLRFPPLLDVAAKPRRTTEDIVSLLKDPPAYGLQPPMRSFNDKLTDQQMREIAAWVVQLTRQDKQK